jgi:hypothetical protein
LLLSFGLSLKDLDLSAQMGLPVFNALLNGLFGRDKIPNAAAEQLQTPLSDLPPDGVVHPDGDIAPRVSVGIVQTAEFIQIVAGNDIAQDRSTPLVDQLIPA